MSVVEVLASFAHPDVPGLNVAKGSFVDLADENLVSYLNSQGKVAVVPDAEEPTPQ